MLHCCKELIIELSSGFGYLDTTNHPFINFRKNEQACKLYMCSEASNACFSLHLCSKELSSGEYHVLKLLSHVNYFVTDEFLVIFSPSKNDV